MIKFSDDLVDTSQIIGNYLDKAFNQYSSYLDQAPVKVKYYSKNAFDSSHDQHIENVQSVVGVNSSVGYHSIENIPIFEITGLDFSTSDGGFGLEADANGSALIIPDTIVPKVDDFFSLKYENITFVYRISKTDINKIKDKSFYKIEFYLSDKKEDDIEKQVTAEKVVMPDITRSENFAVVEKDYSLLLSKILRFMALIQKNYTNLFFLPRLNDLGILTPGNGLLITDRSIKIFIEEYGLLKRLNPIRNEFFLPYELMQTTEFFEKDTTLNFINVIKGIYPIESLDSLGVSLTPLKVENWDPTFHFPIDVVNLSSAPNLNELCPHPVDHIFKGFRNSLAHDYDELQTIKNTDDELLVPPDGKWFENFLSFRHESIFSGNLSSASSSDSNTHSNQLRIYGYHETSCPKFLAIHLFMKKEAKDALLEIEHLLPSLIPTKQTISNFYLTPIVLYILKKIYSDVSGIQLGQNTNVY